MDKIIGKISVEAIEDGSKSQGEVAYITCDSCEKKYKIYRAGMLPQNDTFLCSLAGMTVTASGNIEEEKRNFCIDSLTSENGENIELPAIELPGLKGSIFINSNVEEKSNDTPRRLPRKLKKKIKKQKK